MSANDALVISEESGHDPLTRLFQGEMIKHFAINNELLGSKPYAAKPSSPNADGQEYREVKEQQLIGEQGVVILGCLVPQTVFKFNSNVLLSVVSRL